MDEDEKKSAPAETTVAGEPIGLSEIGGETAVHLPEEEISIELPIEENDFNAQPQ